jgi:hypothetical protein
MHQVEAMKWVRRIFNAAIHVSTALHASVTTDRGIFVNHPQFVTVGGDFQFVARNNRNNGEHRTIRLPALGAAARMVVSCLRSQLNNNRLMGAVASKSAT